MEDRNEVNLGECIEIITGRSVGLRLDEYVYIDTKEKVEDENMALALKMKKEKDIDLFIELVSHTIQIHLDNTAKNNGGWDNMMSARASAKPIIDTDSIPAKSMKENANKLESYYFEVWTKAYELQSNITIIPTVQEILDQLPKFE